MDEKPVPPSTHKVGKKGRPTFNEQVEVVNNIKKYFDNNYHPTVTANALKLDIKTVRKYYGVWKDEILNRTTENIVEQYTVSKEMVLTRFSTLKLKGENALQDIESLITEQKQKTEIKKQSGQEAWNPVNYFLHSKRESLLRYLAELEDMIAKNMMAPAPDQLVEQHIAEMIKKQNEIIQE